MKLHELKFEPTYDLRTPKGKASWPSLHTPNSSQSKGDPMKDKYEVSLLLPEGSPEAVAFMASIDECLEEALKLCNTLAPTKEKDKVTGKMVVVPPKMSEHKAYKEHLNAEKEPTGFIAFKFSMPARYKSKDGRVVENRPALFDRWAKPMVGEIPAIGAGSTIKVSYTMRAYYTDGLGLGVSLRLSAVQVIDLKLGFDRTDPTRYGFGDESDGEEPEHNEESSATESNQPPTDAQDY